MASLTGPASPAATAFDLADYPLLPPPPGQVSNFVDPPTRAPLVVGLCSVCIALVWIFYPWRIFTKAFITKSLWWDDLTATLAAVGATGLAASIIWSQKFFGPHSWDIRAVSIPSYYEQVSLGGTLLNYCLTAMFTKLSLLLLYFRVFAPSRWMRISIWIGAVFTVALYISTTIGYAAACVKRPNETWLEDQISDRCLHDTAPAGYVLGAAGLLTDLYLLILPMPAVWQLQMPKKKKIAVALLFAAALLVFGLYYRIIENLQIRDDPAWNLGIAGAVATIEVAVGIVVCCVPYLRPSLKKSELQKVRLTFRKLLTTSVRHSDGESGSWTVDQFDAKKSSQPTQLQKTRPFSSTKTNDS